MVDAKRIDEWDHTASLMAFIANAFKAEGVPPVDPMTINPYRDSPPGRGVIDKLREIYERGNGRSN